MADETYKFTAKQKAFIREYLKDLNATQAALRAGYSERTAKRIGSENFAKPPIKQEIEKALAKRAEKTEVSAEWLLKRLAAEASADVRDLYNEDGTLKSVHDWPLIWRQGLITGMHVETKRKDKGTVTKLKLSDRVKRLEMIGKHIGVQAFKEKFEHTGEVTINGIEVAFVRTDTTGKS
jgi:phage terminase small subunit